MKQTVVFPFFLCILLAGVLAACDDDNTEKPVIHLISPAEGAVVKAGSILHVEMSLTGSALLSSYKIEIHDNSDHHSHAHETKAGADDPVAFAFNQSWSIDTDNATHETYRQDIGIPADAKAGDYHFMVYCTDVFGNEATPVLRNIEIEH